MPRFSSSRRPILGRAMAILTTLPLTPAAKARAARTLLLFKKRARRLRHYSYAYVGEYQFSPSGSPLLLLPRPPAWRSAAKQRRGRGTRARAVLASLFLCGGCGGREGEWDGLDGLPPRPVLLEDDGGACIGYEEVYGGEEEEEYEVEVEEQDEIEEEEEVDRRAERFIERFYQEMRMQETQRLLL